VPNFENVAVRLNNTIRHLPMEISPAMPDDKRAVSFADLFLALLYSVTLVLIFAWIHDCQVPNVPPSLANVVGNFYTCVIAGVASAVLSAILQKKKKSLSWFCYGLLL
jgi:hypothetical protein